MKVHSDAILNEARIESTIVVLKAFKGQWYIFCFQSILYAILALFIEGKYVNI